MPEIKEEFSKTLNYDFSKYLLIRYKFGTHWIQRIGPIHDCFHFKNCLNKHLFWVHKRKASLCAQKLFLIGKKN